MAATSDSIPDAVRAAWERVTEGWDDASRHDALLAQVAQYSCYVWAAARYREHGDDPMARRQLDRLRRAATATMLATATARPSDGEHPYRATIAVFAMLMVAFLVGLLVVMMLHARAASPAGAPHRVPHLAPHAPHPAAPARPAAH